MEQGFCQPPTRQLWIMRSVQNSFLKKFLPHLVKEPREASKSVRCERVPEPPGRRHGLFHAAPNLLIKAFVPEHSVAVWSSSRMNSTSTTLIIPTAKVFEPLVKADNAHYLGAWGGRAGKS